MKRSSLSRRWRLGVGAVFLLSFGCKEPSAKQGKLEAQPSSAEAEFAVPVLPPTRSAKVVLGGIDATIESLEELLQKQTDAFSQKEFGAQLVELRLERGPLVGDVSDYVAAKELADRLAATSAKRWPHLFLVQARAAAALHYFDDASNALNAAVASGSVSEPETLPLRVSIWLARGETRRAWLAIKEPSKRKPAAATVFLAAVALADLGEIDGAEREFRRALAAQAKNRAPLPIVRTLFHWGRMWERQGKRARAKSLYTVAFERFPQYAPLAAHLAALEAEAGNVARAITILDPIAERATDPDYKGQLGALLAGSDTERSTQLLTTARRDYDALLADEWRAFADHAARFYLGSGADNAKAFRLAAKNLENRKSDESFQLFLDAALANANASAQTCAVATEAAARADASAYLYFAASRTLGACGDESRSAAALARAESAVRAR